MERGVVNLSKVALLAGGVSGTVCSEGLGWSGLVPEGVKSWPMGINYLGMQ